MEDPIAAILDSRLSPERVRQIAELLYANASYTLSERLGYANRRRFNPYPAEFGTLRGVTWTGQVICGHNPHLNARLVQNVRVEQDQNGHEKLLYDELPKPDLSWMDGEV